MQIHIYSIHTYLYTINTGAYTCKQRYGFVFACACALTLGWAKKKYSILFRKLHHANYLLFAVSDGQWPKRCSDISAWMQYYIFAEIQHQYFPHLIAPKSLVTTFKSSWICYCLWVYRHIRVQRASSFASILSSNHLLLTLANRLVFLPPPHSALAAMLCVFTVVNLRRDFMHIRLIFPLAPKSRFYYNFDFSYFFLSFSLFLHPHPFVAPAFWAKGNCWNFAAPIYEWLSAINGHMQESLMHAKIRLVYTVRTN